MRIFTVIEGVALLTLSCCAAVAQDATVAAPNNYKVEFENELVRIVRVTYAPYEKSPMHEHQGNPAVIVVLKGGGRMHFVYPDGTTSEGKQEETGSVRFVPTRAPFKHAGENAVDKPTEVVRVELKTNRQTKPCAAQ